MPWLSWPDLEYVRLSSRLLYYAQATPPPWKWCIGLRQFYYITRHKNYDTLGLRNVYCVSLTILVSLPVSAFECFHILTFFILFSTIMKTLKANNQHSAAFFLRLMSILFIISAFDVCRFDNLHYIHTKKYICYDNYTRCLKEVPTFKLCKFVNS